MDSNSRAWLKTYLDELETAGNKVITQIYEDSDGKPSTVVGGGSIAIAGYALATQVATATAHPEVLVELITTHRLMSETKLGPDAWPDVLHGAILHLAFLYLEPAYKVTDSTDYDMRAAASQWWATLQEASGAHDHDA